MATSTLILGPAGRDKSGHALKRVRCHCGKEFVARGDHVRSGRTTSCGCGRKGRKPTHKLSYTWMYGKWHGMMRRCYDPKHPSYKNYGGRGITVDPEWHDVVTFCKFAKANLDSDLEMGRIRNNEGYGPGNVESVDRSTNARTRRHKWQLPRSS